MTDGLFAVRWASDQVLDEWIKPAIGCEWFNPEGERMAIDDVEMREALLERLLAGQTQLEHRMMILDDRLRRIEVHQAGIDRNLERMARVASE